MDKKIVIVTWIDTSIIDDQTPEKELIENMSCLDDILTCGFLTYEDDEKIVVSRDYCNNEFRGNILIPKITIKGIEFREGSIHDNQTPPVEIKIGKCVRCKSEFPVPQGCTRIILCEDCDKFLTEQCACEYCSRGDKIACINKG